MVLTTALATVTGGTAMLVIGMGTGAFQSGLDSYLNQRNSGFAVDWGTVGKEALKGGVISGISGGMGGALANAATPLKFCGKGALEIAGDVVEHWAIGTLGDAATGMVTTYVSERFDGKSPQEAFQSTMSSADDILLEAAITSAAGTFVDSITAPKCFVAGTMITTINGLTAIENIQPGDVVLAANEETGEVAYKEVVRTFVNTTDEITHVTIENADGEMETIDSTPQHPFYVEGIGWVEASSLHAGMTIWFANGTKGTVEDISNEGLEEPVTVYNFEVEDFHTYFVGESGVLVHNVCNGNEASATPTPNTEDGNSTDLRTQAENARDNLIANTPGGNKKAMAVGAYDVETGNVVADFAGPIPETISPVLQERASNIGGIGTTGLTERNTVGSCAEFRAANQLLLNGSNIENIRFTDAVRPRTGEVKPACDNCLAMFSDIIGGL